MYDRFKELGVPVSITRNDDKTLSPSERPNVVKSFYGNGSDVIVLSNHINSGGGEGAEVIYALRNSNNLSSKILNALESAGQVTRKYYQRRLPSNTSKDYYYIIRDTDNNETVIIEYGFLDNVNDSNRLKANYKSYAEAVVKAVCEYADYNYSLPNNQNTYTVKKGDTLWGISNMFGLSVSELKSLNNLKSDNLSIGDVLYVKSNPISYDNYYFVKPGDTLWGISRKFNISVQKLKDINNLLSDNLYIGQKLLVGDNDSYYVVEKGDTLWSISRMFGLSVNDLKTINGLSNNTISIGQKLKIK